MKNIDQIKNEIIDDNYEFTKHQRVAIYRWIQKAYEYGYAKGSYDRADDAGIIDGDDVNPDE